MSAKAELPNIARTDSIKIDALAEAEPKTVMKRFVVDVPSFDHLNLFSEEVDLP